MDAQETEVKFHIRDLARLEIRLRQLGAELVQERVEETNLRFDTADRKLGQAYQVLRLRRDRKAWITFKGPGQEREGILSRVEIETEVADFDKACLSAPGGARIRDCLYIRKIPDGI